MIDKIFKTRKEFEDLLITSDYDFLRDKENFPLGLMYLCLGGSYAYDTNKIELRDGEKPSDVDFRGISFNPKSNLLFLKDNQKEQVVDVETDTTIYYFNKYAELLYNANPTILDLMGVSNEKIFLETPESKLLRDNIDIFLTKKVIFTFGKYAESQFHLIQKALNKNNISQFAKEERMLESVMKTLKDTMNKASQKLKIGEDIKLYIDKSLRDDIQNEVFVDANFTKYPLKDLEALLSSANCVVNRYNKIGNKKKNEKKNEDDLFKPSMYIIKLIKMCTEILYGKGIITSRKESGDFEFLTDIRSEKYAITDIFKFYEDLVKEMNYAFDNSSLRDDIDTDKAKNLIMLINEMTVDRYRYND
ncbi:MAG: hypothetical protein K0R54_745 [Clostridiaceae bacterium]|jgi:predicted nucleotidyltransferase|nr:hypothetical protein [Clostridiaceae bacterium]